MADRVADNGRVAMTGSATVATTCEGFPDEPGVLFARLSYAQKMRDRLLSQVGADGDSATATPASATAGVTATKFVRLTQEHVDKLKEAAAIAAADGATATTGSKSDAELEYERVTRALTALPLLTQQFSGWAMFDSQCNYLAVLADSVPLFLTHNYPWVRRMVHEPSFKLMNENNPVAENINLLTALDNYIEPIPVFTPLLFALLHAGKPHELCAVPMYISALTLYRFYCNARMWLMQQDDADVLAKQYEDAEKKASGQDTSDDGAGNAEKSRQRVMLTVKDVRDSVERSSKIIAARLKLMYSARVDEALRLAHRQHQQQQQSEADAAHSPTTESLLQRNMPLRELAEKKKTRTAAARHTLQVLRALEAQIITLLRLPGTTITALATPPVTLPVIAEVDSDTLEDCNTGRLYMLSLLQQVASHRRDEATRLNAKDMRYAPFRTVDVDNPTTLAEAYLYMRLCALRRLDKTTLKRRNAAASSPPQQRQ